MKKLLGVLFITLSVIFAACEKDKSQVQPSGKTTENGTYEREVVFSDASKKNSAVFKFSGPDEESVDEYLATFDFIVIPSDGISSEYVPADSANAHNSDTTQLPAEEPLINIELVKLNLEEGVKGVQVQQRLKASSTAKTSAFITTYTQVTPGDYYYLVVQNVTPISITNSPLSFVIVTYQYRDWVWKDYSQHTLWPGQQCMQANGTYKLRARLFWDPYHSWVTYFFAPS